VLYFIVVDNLPREIVELVRLVRELTELIKEQRQ